MVNRLMVVVVKASVAAEQLEKALLAANKTPGMRCNCKPGKELPPHQPPPGAVRRHAAALSSLHCQCWVCRQVALAACFMCPPMLLTHCC